MDRIDRLRLFLRLADCGSFTRVAEQLGLPRATVSTALRQLETRLGVRLLHRTTRRVSLTADGEALRERATALVESVDDLERHFQPDAGALSGRLRVDAPSRIARRFIVPALADFFARHPGLDIELGAGDHLVDLAREGVDCALRVGPLAASSLIARPLGAFDMVNCASPAYLARYGVPQYPQDLDAHWTIEYGAATGNRAANWAWQAQGDTRHMRLSSRLSVNHVEPYIAGALAGMGLIQVPRFDVCAHLDAGELVEILPNARPAPMPVHLVYPHRRHLPQRVRVFQAWIEELLAPHLLAVEIPLPRSSPTSTASTQRPVEIKKPA